MRLFIAFFLRNKQFLQNTIAVSMLSLVQRVLGLVVVYILVRILEPEEFGQYQFIFSILGVLTIFSLPGLNGAVMQSTARGLIGTFKSTLRVSFYWSLVGAFVLVIIAAWHQFYEPDLATPFLICALLYPFYSFKRWRSVLSGRQKFNNLLIVDFLFASITVAVVFFASTTDFSQSYLVTFLCITLLIPSLQNLVATIYLLKKIPKHAQSEEGSKSYGLNITLYSSLNIIANHLDKLLIYSFLSPASLAIYFAAEKMAEFTKTIAQNIATALAPRFATTKNYSKKLNIAINRLVIFLGGGILVFAVTALPWLVNFIFGEDYNDAVNYAQALLITIVIGNYASIKNKFINSKLDQDSNKKITVISSLSRIIFSLVFVPVLGVWGAVVSTFIYRLITVYVVRKVIKEKYLIEAE